MKKIIISNLLIYLLTVTLGCQGYSITGGPGKNASASLKSESNRTGDLLTVNSLFVSNVEIPDEVRTNSDIKFDFSTQLNDAVSEELGMRVFYAAKDLHNDTTDSDHYVKALNEAKRVKADGILVTKVTNFIQREGSAVGSERPAEVDFSMQIIRLSDNKTIWQSTYHFKDQSLSDNLFKIKDRFSKESRLQFRTAEDLIKGGYRSALSDFSKQRLAQFTAVQ